MFSILWLCFRFVQTIRVVTSEYIDKDDKEKLRTDTCAQTEIHACTHTYVYIYIWYIYIHIHTQQEHRKCENLRKDKPLDTYTQKSQYEQKTLISIHIRM